MAEAIVNHMFTDTWVAFSAGTTPAGFVHPMALKVLAEIGIHHKGSSKSISVFREIQFDLIVTVCDHAAENCPIWPGTGKRMHLSFPDPAQVTGNQDEIEAAFKSVREQIMRDVSRLLTDISHASA